MGYLGRLADEAYSICKANSSLLMPEVRGGSLLDLGCDDGEMTVKLAARAGVSRVYGIDITSRLRLAAKRGVITRRGDLNHRFPFTRGSMDIVHANQVIEHVDHIDHFLAECHRVLKPGGWLVLGTENLASWHNIAATIFGYQPFSSSNITEKVGGLGNPWALHRGERLARDVSWMHVTLLSYQAFLEYQEIYGFEVTRTRGAGYYPFPHFLAALDPRHAVYIHSLARKKP